MEVKAIRREGSCRSCREINIRANLGCSEVFMGILKKQMENNNSFLRK